MTPAAGRQPPEILLYVAVFAVLTVFVLTSLSTIDNNDFMYAPAPITWQQNGALYRDVPFNQAPLSIFVPFVVMKIFSIENVFLICRILSMILVIGAVAVSAFALRHTASRPTIMLFVVLSLSHPIIMSNGTEIGSYALPLFLMSCALAVPTLQLSPAARGMLVGVALGLAASAKLSFLLLVPAFLALLLFEVERSWRMVVWFAIGGLVGGSPLVYYAATDLDALYKWTVRFHTLTLYSRGQDSAHWMSQIAAGLEVVGLWLVVPVGLFLLRMLPLPAPAQRGRWAMALGFVVCGAVMAAAARVLYTQYVAPLVLLLLFFSLPQDATPPDRKRMFWAVGSVLFVLQFVPVSVGLIRKIDFVGFPMIEVIKMQRRAENTAATLSKCDLRLYSSQALFLLKSGVKYPAEFAVGPFLMALRGGTLAPEDVGLDVEARLNEWKPNVVIYGYYLSQQNQFGEVERMLEAYVRAHGLKIEPLTPPLVNPIFIAYDEACR